MADDAKITLTPDGKGGLLIPRVFEAPRDFLWKAWTKPERLIRWWGPKDFTTPFYSIDLRVGGKILSCMESPEGQKFWSTGTFREIREPERLVVTDSFADDKGNVVPASHYGFDPDFPLEMVVTLTLEELEEPTFERSGRTRLTLRHTGASGLSPDHLESMKMSWEESFDKLEAFLRSCHPTIFKIIPDERKVVIERFFDAPATRLFKAYTERELIPRWWGPARLRTEVETMDVTPGGIWRYVQRDEAGKEYAFNGMYDEIVPGTRIVHTYEFEGTPGHRIIERISFDDHAKKSKLTIVSMFQTDEDLESMVDAGMEEGVTESMDRLSTIVEEVPVQVPT